MPGSNPYKRVHNGLLNSLLKKGDQKESAGFILVVLFVYYYTQIMIGLRIFKRAVFR